MNDDSKNAGVTTSRIKFCDLKCEFADFPKQEHRTFAALWCSQLQKLVTKNAPCAVEFGQRRPKSNL